MTKYHFIGIGGIGMSALARILIQRGFNVQGSDKDHNTLIRELERLGAKIISDTELKDLDSSCTIVFSSAIPASNLQYQQALKRQSIFLHRSELLTQLMRGYKTLLVAGTHGKTTTSSLLAHVLSCAHYHPSFAIGGIALNFETNGNQDIGEYFVAETDESDGSFLHHEAYAAIITNIGKDHLNYWKTKEALVEGFKKFASRVTSLLWWSADDPLLASLRLQGKSYGFSPEADVWIQNWKQYAGKIFFTFSYLGKQYVDVEIPLLGKHNVINSAAVFGLGLQLGITEEVLRLSLKTFKGVKRRLERRGENNGVCFYDDYAHHPTEIKETLKALKQECGEKRLVGIFQPHRYTRLRDCWEDFVHSFEDVDVLFVTDIYSAGEPVLEEIRVEELVQQIQKVSSNPIYCCSRPKLVKHVGSYLRPHDVVVTLGAGDIKDIIDEMLNLEISSLKIGIVQGGKSAEHEISCLSAALFQKSLSAQYYDQKIFTISKQGKWVLDRQERSWTEIIPELLTCDIVLPVLHGPYGEDGAIQGFFETLGIPYIGCDFKSCVVSMNKNWTKKLISYHGIPTANFQEFLIDDWYKDSKAVVKMIAEKIGFPCYLKPSHLGSTIGVHKIHNIEEIEPIIQSVLKLDYSFLVEEEVQGREIEFGIIGSQDPNVSDPLEITLDGEFHTYKNKYSREGKEPIPKANIAFEVKEKGREIAKTIYKVLGCTGLARVDFFLRNDGSWIFNEINPMPGCTPNSAYPIMWKAEGLEFKEVVDRLIISGLYRHRYLQKTLQPLSPDSGIVVC